MSPATASGGEWLRSGCVRALVAMSLRRLPAGAAERYLEEFHADLAELGRTGGFAPLKHAVGIASTSRRLIIALAGPPPLPGRTWALLALAHLGLVPDPRGPDARDGAYVFPPGGTLRWRPRQRRPPNLSDSM